MKIGLNFNERMFLKNRYLTQVIQRQEKTYIEYQERLEYPSTLLDMLHEQPHT